MCECNYSDQTRLHARALKEDAKPQHVLKRDESEEGWEELTALVRQYHCTKSERGRRAPQENTKEKPKKKWVTCTCTPRMKEILQKAAFAWERRPEERRGSCGKKLAVELAFVPCTGSPMTSKQQIRRWWTLFFFFKTESKTNFSLCSVIEVFSKATSNGKEPVSFLSFLFFPS